MEKELLQRYVEGNVSVKEVNRIVDWLDQDEEHVREFMALHKLYDITLFSRQHAAEKSKKAKRAGSFRRIGMELLKIVAILLLVWGAGKLLQSGTYQPDAFQTFIIPAGQRGEVILPDGTHVWLNAKTEIVYPVQFGNGNREIRLNGEAYFDVAHNPDQPFIVKTEKMEVEVVGTEFNVLAYTGIPAPAVALLDGEVCLRVPGIPQPYIMKRNEQVRLEEGRLYVSPIIQFDYFKWKEGILSFESETVASIMNKLQLYFDVRIDVQRRGLPEHKYTGKFRIDDGVEQVLKVLQLEHEFTYTRDRDLNLITIK